MRVALVLLVALAIDLFGGAYSHAQETPYQPEVSKRFKTVEAEVDVLQALPAAQSYTAEGISNLRVARFNYSVATDGGTIGAHNLGVALPAKAVIVRSWFRVDTQFVDAGSGTVALSCEDANNIKTATDITGSSAGAFVEGQSTGAASAFIASIGAACNITATVAGADQTDGKLTGFVEYVVHD
jgi:hypothetical protein